MQDTGSIRLCALADLEQTGARGVELDPGGKRRRIAVVAWQGAVYAYENVCPHARLPLEFLEHRFFDATGRFVLCANHGAYFEADTGLCLRGPCAGQSLTPVAVCVRGGDVYLEPDEGGQSP